LYCTQYINKINEKADNKVFYLCVGCADTAVCRRHQVFLFTTSSFGAMTMFSDIAIRVGVCYFGAILVLTGTLQLVG
jgi:hypothetical protein